MLRQPLENGKVTISRAHSTVTYPATFLFIGAMNPCHVPFEQLLRASSLLEKQEQMIKQVFRKQGFSNRVHIKVIRLARTIADLKGERDISDEAIWEAFTLRRTRKKGVGIRSLRTN
jgi:predicted ATPase with chaperone activity